jgi:hypothetical protein
MLSPDFKEFVQLLNKNDVSYLIAGGYAVGIHGHPRYTGDLDIGLLPTKDNADQIIESVQEFGVGSLPITAENLQKEEMVIQPGYPPLRIDLLTSIDGVSFEECYPNRKMVTIDGLPVNFIGYHNLIKNKKASGRHQDLGDVENLQT